MIIYNGHKMAVKVVGSGGGGGGSSSPLAIQVSELPTENIDDSKIYVLNEIKNAEVYYFNGEKYCTIPSVVSEVVGVTPTINHYVVNELPTNAEITDLQTFSVINCYIFNDVAYVYGNAGAGNMWLTVSAIFAQMGNPTEDKGRVYDLADTSVEIGLYAYYEEFQKFYLYSDNEWKEISDSTSDKYILRLSGDNGVLSDEQYQSLVDNFSNTTIIYTLGSGTIVFNTIFEADGVYIAAVSMDTTTTAIYISKHNWFYQTTYLTDVFVRKNGINDIYADNTFSANNTFSESSNVEFKGEVNFANANVIGLSSGGGGSSGSSLSYKEIKLTNMFSTGYIDGAVSIKCWLPDTVNITDFGSLVSAIRTMAGGNYTTAKPHCQCINAEGSLGTAINGFVDILKVAVTSANALLLLTQTISTTTNKLLLSIEETLTNATVTVTNLI